MTDIINLVLGVPLGWVMWLCYTVIPNYGIAIIFFTFLSKIILMPVSILVQKNSIKMIKLQPEMNQIAVKYAGDKDTIAEKQMELYDREKYSPALGCLPMFLQIPLILGLINVIYNPLQHLLRVSMDVIYVLTTHTEQLLGVSELGGAAQLRIVEAIHNPAFAESFLALNIPNVDMSLIINQIKSLDTVFLGIDLAKIPPLFTIGVIMLVPLISCLSTIWLCFAQNKVNVLQKEQGFMGKWGVTIFTVAFSTYFTFIVPAGVGLYWIFGNVFAVIQLYFLNWLYNPAKHIDYAALEESKVSLAAIKESEQAKKKELAPYKAKEKEDYKRFFKGDETKNLVFYSESNGFYKYFEDIIHEILNSSDITIHYVTSDPNDSIFKRNNPKIVPYYIGEIKLITFMMKLDADVVVMTMPDLECYHIKRSYVRKSIEYIYTDHGISSNNLTLRNHALDHYNTIFCVGPHQVEEYKKIEQVYKIKPRNLIETGYSLLDNMAAAYEKTNKESNDIKTILVAPSWQEDNLLDSCIDEIVQQLVGKSLRVIIRPHPQYVRKYSDKMAAIIAKYSHLFCDNFAIETDFSSNVTVYTADLLITDWSNIGYEFSFATYKPTLCINTKMKVMNPDYEKLDIVPFDIRVRSQIGAELDPQELFRLYDVVNDLIERTSEYYETNKAIKESSFFNLGKSGVVGGQYIIKRCAELKAEREKAEGLA